MTIFVIAIVGLALGGVSAAYVIDRSQALGAISSGPWKAVAFAAAGEVDPYTIARSVIEGSVPLGATEGLSFVALTDSEDRELDLKCQYVLEGNTPAAKLWTLTSYHPDGLPVTPAPGGKSSIFSGSMLRFADGSFRIAVSSLPNPGNWLSISGEGRLRFALRLYDTQVAGSSGHEQLKLPAIVRGECDA
ncbi:MAG: DUF1214 domain-containing protein [Rhizobiaceae bacterium]